MYLTGDRCIGLVISGFLCVRVPFGVLGKVVLVNGVFFFLLLIFSPFLFACVVRILKNSLEF